MSRFLKSIAFLSCLIFCTATLVHAENELNGKYFTLKDSNNRIIARTALQVSTGDEYINSSNQLYRVTKISGTIARVKLVKNDALKVSAWSNVRAFLTALFQGEFFKTEVKQRGPIAIYHTHSDESYVQGDGVSSKKGNGGIFQIGDSLTKAFENEGVPVVHSKVPHDPHDALAYDRSRRTAAQLLKERPTVLLDVHRDAVPRQEYAAQIRNENATKIQLVVGRQNPSFNVSNDFAKQIKASVDKKAPGLIKGIFYGKGKYNQDLAPRAMLLEIGSHTNSKSAAERGAVLFAAAAKDVLYGSAGAGNINRGGLRSSFWIIAAVLGAIGLFLLLNRRGLKDIGKEFTGAVGEDVKNEEEDPSEKHRHRDKP